jgi:hypothetical protein
MVLRVHKLGGFSVGSSFRARARFDSIDDLINELFGLCDSLVDEVQLDFSEVALDALELFV